MEYILSTLTALVLGLSSLFPFQTGATNASTTQKGTTVASSTNSNLNSQDTNNPLTNLGTTTTTTASGDNDTVSGQQPDRVPAENTSSNMQMPTNLPENAVENSPSLVVSGNQITSDDSANNLVPSVSPKPDVSIDPIKYPTDTVSGTYPSQSNSPTSSLPDNNTHTSDSGTQANNGTNIGGTQGRRVSGLNLGN